MAKPPVLQLPFQGSWFVYWGGDTKDVNYHHDDKAETYALDLVKADEKGNFFKGSGLKNEDYYAYGQSVLAPAGGKVIEAVDGMRENQPTKTTNNYMRFGNSVIIEHGQGLYSIIAHLRPGSVQVKSGDLVETGQKLGECGNSGNSSEPHLHFHLQDNQTLTTFSANYEKLPLAKGIKPYFDLNIHKNKSVEKKSHYSPVRGDIISPV
jgi:murein DD-endopeptidase MepM/ murein hydrolase activator NlpD